MTPSHGYPRGTPLILACFLLLAGLACGAGFYWTSRVDLPGLVEQRIISAHGVISPETSAWLRSGVIQSRLLGSAVALIAFGIVALFLRPRLLARLASGQFLWTENRSAPSTPPISTDSFRWVGLVTSLVAIVWYFPTLSSGYFRYDDFDLLAWASHGPFWATLWQPHGDHFLPLTRLLFWLGLKIAGTTAWPYNLWLIICFCGVLWTGTGLLSDLKISAAAQLVFAALVIFWSPWAEIMTGYYILSTYLLIALLGLAAIRFYLSWLNTARLAAAMAAGGSLLGAALDISGFHAFGVFGVFLALNFITGRKQFPFVAWLTRHKPMLSLAAVSMGIALACTLYDYRVLHPGTFLGMAGETQRRFLQFAGDLGYLFNAGVVLSMATPFVYARLPVILLATLSAAVLISWLFFSIMALRAADQSRRWTLAAIFLAVMGACLMVSLGRHSTDTLIVRWAAKHICPAYIWFCLLLAVSWDTLWRSSRRPGLFAEVTLIAMGLFVAAQTAIGLLGMTVSFPPFGYPAELRDAERRQAAVEFLRQHLGATLGSGSFDRNVVPTLDGAYIKAIYPSLFDYNFSRYVPFFADTPINFQLVRGPGMQPSPDGEVNYVPDLRRAVSPIFLTALRNNPELRAFYLREIPIGGIPLTESSVPPRISRITVRDGSMEREVNSGATIESDGKTEILIRGSTWAPPSASHLQLNIQPLTDALSSELPVTVVFWSEVAGREWSSVTNLNAATLQGLDFDLRQAYAFSLSSEVGNLRVILTKPGQYRVLAANLMP